jgi:hypothetical protein
MNNIDYVVKILRDEAKNGFSRRADQEFCDLLTYGYEFRKQFMIKRMHAFS